MAAAAARPPSPALHIARVPGRLGLIVRCSGELTVVTGEALRRELDLLVGLGHATLTLNLSECSAVDADGVLIILDTYKRLRERSRRFALVSGKGAAARVFRVLGIDRVIPVFPTETAAELALRGGSATDPAPVTWGEARSEALLMWRGILTVLEMAPADEVMRRITSSHGLCLRAKELLAARSAPADDWCSLCPLFHTLGARVEHVGCQSITQPMLEALLASDRRAAGAQVIRLIGLIETMPLPGDD